MKWSKFKENFERFKKRFDFYELNNDSIIDTKNGKVVLTKDEFLLLLSHVELIDDKIVHI